MDETIDVDTWWRGKPLFSKLEDTLGYQGHSEVCGCWNEGHGDTWLLNVKLTEAELKRIMSALNKFTKSV